MSILYPFTNSKGGFCVPSSLRLIQKLDIIAIDLKPTEVVISKDYVSGETLVGSSLSGGKTRYTGRLYEKLINLKLPLDFSRVLNSEEKQMILDFVSKFGRPFGIETASANMRSDPNKSFFGDGDKINWVFMHYVSFPQDWHRMDFFSQFRTMYHDFTNMYQLVKLGDYKQLDRYYFVFNNGLRESHLQIPYYEEGIKTRWISDSCLAQCYLELYELIISHQTIKVCKYCGNDFESSKSNETCCFNCRKPDLYRKLYYEKNRLLEQQKAKQRMARLRNIKN